MRQASRPPLRIHTKDHLESKTLRGCRHLIDAMWGGALSMHCWLQTHPHLIKNIDKLEKSVKFWDHLICNLLGITIQYQALLQKDMSESTHLNSMYILWAAIQQLTIIQFLFHFIHLRSTKTPTLCVCQASYMISVYIAIIHRLYQKAIFLHQQKNIYTPL